MVDGGENNSDQFGTKSHKYTDGLNLFDKIRGKKGQGAGLRVLL